MTAKRRYTLLVRLTSVGGALLWIAFVAADRGLLERFELATLDTELSIAPASGASPQIVIVAADERAVHRYGPLRWPPERMTEIVNALDGLGASVIAFDFVFSGEGGPYTPAKRTDSGQAFRAALQRSGKVVLGTYFDFDSDAEGEHAIPPADFREHRVKGLRYLGGAVPQAVGLPVPVATGVHAVVPELAEAARSYGHLNIVPSGDGIIRWMPLVVRYQGDYYADFAVEVARAHLRNIEGECAPEVLIGKQRLEGLALGSAASRQMNTASCWCALPDRQEASLPTPSWISWRGKFCQRRFATALCSTHARSRDPRQRHQ